MKLYEFFNDPDSTFVFANNDLEACNFMAIKLGQFTTNDIKINHYDKYSVLTLDYLRFEFWTYEIKLGTVG